MTTAGDLKLGLILPQRDRFGCVPVFWCQLLATVGAWKVAVALLGRADKYGNAYASISQLARDAGIDARNVRRGLAELERSGVAARTEVGTGRRSSRYAMRLSKLSVCPSAQAKPVRLRSGAQANDKAAVEVPPERALERRLECAPQRTHTDNIINSNARAREAPTPIIDRPMTDDEWRAGLDSAGYRKFQEMRERANRDNRC
jgi:DNA-binding Lrp family transcriptional regulator